MRRTMDLTESCHHCGAAVGKSCKRDCFVNGDIYSGIDLIASRMKVSPDVIVKQLERIKDADREGGQDGV